jgi:predicted  nucleic acid-binding Zn-ribbon protein
MDYGGDEKKIQAFTSEIAEQEGRGLEILGELELNEQERNDAKTFLAGIEKTIADIESEVKGEIGKEEEQIKIIDFRLSGLREDLPSDFKQLLEKLLSKNLAHGPFTRIDQGSCLFCRYKISRIDESEIDMQKKLKTCPQCSRIFIPYGT